MPLTDCAPLVVADAHGLFAKRGLRVEMSAAGAWAALRDRLSFGALDGAHLLYPMPIAAALGQGQPARDWVAACGLGQNGNTLILSEEICEELERPAPPLAAAALAPLLRRRAAEGRMLRLAVVHIHSTHSYILRSWLEAAGIDTESEVRIEVVPPQLMAEELIARRIDGFCAGEPWGSHAVIRGAGRLAFASGSLWPDHAEKLLAFSRDAVSKDRDVVIEATAAVIEAAHWLDQPENRAAATVLMQERVFYGLDYDSLVAAFAGEVPEPEAAPWRLSHPMRFLAATRPDPVQTRAWFNRMRRWGHVPSSADETVALAPFANSIWAEALKRTGLSSHFLPSLLEDIAP